MENTLAAHLAVGVYIDPLVVVAEQELHAVGVGEGHDGVGRHGALGVLGHVDVIHAEMERCYRDQGSDSCLKLPRRVEVNRVESAL